MKGVRKIGYVFFLILFLIFILGPFLWAFLLSITPEYAMFTNHLSLLPKEVTWENYKALFLGTSRQGQLLFQGMWNSIRAIIVTFCIGFPVAILSAYVLCRMEFKGKNVIKNCLLITMVIPVMATIIPIYRIFVKYQLLDQIFWLSIVYVSSYLPMLIWLLSNYFATLPKELEEVAWIDGAGRVRTFFQILIPMSYPIIFTSALIIFLNTWSQFQIPLILASSLETKPVAIIASEFMTKDTIQYGLTAAAGLLAIVCPAVTAFVFRRFLIAGMIKGAIKG